MHKDTVTVEIRIPKMSLCEDLEIPLDITVNDFIIALNQIFNLHMNLENMSLCYLKTENPIALLKGNRLIRDFGVRNGTIFNL